MIPRETWVRGGFPAGRAGRGRAPRLPEEPPQAAAGVRRTPGGGGSRRARRGCTSAERGYSWKRSFETTSFICGETSIIIKNTVYKASVSCSMEGIQNDSLDRPGRFVMKTFGYSCEGAARGTSRTEGGPVT